MRVVNMWLSCFFLTDIVFFCKAVKNSWVQPLELESSWKKLYEFGRKKMNAGIYLEDITMVTWPQDCKTSMMLYIWFLFLPSIWSTVLNISCFTYISFHPEIITEGITSSVGQDDENQHLNIYFLNKNKDIQKHFSLKVH